VGSTAIFLTYDDAVLLRPRPAAPDSASGPDIVISPFAKPPPGLDDGLLRLAPDLIGTTSPRAAVAEHATPTIQRPFDCHQACPSPDTTHPQVEQDYLAAHRPNGGDPT